MDFPEHFSFFLFARGCLDVCVRSLHNLPVAEVARAIGQAGQTQRQVACQLNISQSHVTGNMSGDQDLDDQEQLGRTGIWVIWLGDNGFKVL